MGCASSQALPPEEGELAARKEGVSSGIREVRKAVQVNGKTFGPLSGGEEVPPTSSSSVLPFPVYPSVDREHLKSFSSEPPREFTYSELDEATDSFHADLVVGEGGFGKVYEGWIQERDPCKPGNRKHVAVKKLNPEGLQGFNEWLTEVIFLRRLHHPHLVHLVGYCTEGGEGLLVYEYMPNGSLDFHLFSDQTKGLTWEQRVKIALGAAKGLAYLHEGTDRQVIFRDLKAGNILLDHDFTSKLSDFGLAKDGPAGDKTHVSTKVVGTYGYTAPEYMQTGHLTAKSDVYAFGVVLLELLSGRRAVDMSRPWEERSLVFWAKPFLSDRRQLSNLIDPRLDGRYPMKGAQKFAVSAQCCLLDAKSRPSMKDMVQTLKALQELTEMDGERPTSQYRESGSAERNGGGQAPAAHMGGPGREGDSDVPGLPPASNEPGMSPYNIVRLPAKFNGLQSPLRSLETQKGGRCDSGEVAGGSGGVEKQQH